MKKILVSLLVLLLVSNYAYAKDIDRKLIKNADVKEVADIVNKTIDLYSGAITIKEKDNQNYKYVVEYNGTTALSVVGVTKFGDNKYVKALFSCDLKQQGNNVLITNRKVKYSGFFRMKPVFNHYKKIYQELEFNGYKIERI